MLGRQKSAAARAKKMHAAKIKQKANKVKPPKKRLALLSAAETEAQSPTLTNIRKHGNDRTLVLVIIILVVFGLIMVFSASAPAASAYQGNPYHYIIRQAAFAVLGMISMFFISCIDYHKYGKFAFLILVGSFLLLLAVYIPGLGRVVNNARRWVGYGVFSLQPSEVAKVAIIIYFAYSLSIVKDKIVKFKDGLLRYLIILGLFSIVLIKEPHFSGTVVICCTGMIMLLVAGARFWHFFIMGCGALAAGVFLIFSADYRMERLTAFLNPFADPADTGFQVVNSLYAIGSGGIFGLGLGMSRQKFLYLPEPQNDFIFAIICEELGLLGAAAVIILFAVLIWKGYRIAQEAPDLFGSLLATGITSLIAIQTVLNIAVVTSSVPVTGVALPFFSYGGTSLFILLSSMGILLNVSRQTVARPPDNLKK